MRPQGLEGLSEGEVDRLAERLGQIQNANALSLEGVDGLFCALIASPESMLPSQYLPLILGGMAEDSHAFADLQDANDTMALLMRYWNSIITDFDRESIHLPYIVEPGIDGIPGRAWARGFMCGVRLAPRGWNQLLTDEDEGLLISIPLVAGEMDPTWPKKPLTDEKKDELLQWMFAGADRAYRDFSDDRRESAQAFNPTSLARMRIIRKPTCGLNLKSGAMNRARAGAAKCIRNAAGRQIPGLRNDMVTRFTESLR